MNALFRTSLKCAPDEEILEPDIEAEPLSPSRAAALAAYEDTPFPVITLNPAAISVSIPATEVEVTTPATEVEVTTEMRNEGGAAGEYHVCDSTVPKWMKLENGRGSLAPGETAQLCIVVDATAVAEEAAAIPAPTPCAVLRVDVDGGGTGILLPITCSFDEGVVEST